MSENVNESSVAIGEIASEIADVDPAAGELAANSTQVNQNSPRLSGLAGELKEMIGGFRG